MLRSLTGLSGYKVTVGGVLAGAVEGCLFDDGKWTVRYFIIDRARAPGVGGPVLRSAGGSRLVFVPAELVHAVDWLSGEMLLSASLPDVESKLEPESQRFGPLPRELRPLDEVVGYQVRTVDGELGYVDDFIAQDGSWQILQLVVQWPGNAVLVPRESIRSIHWSERRVHVALSRQGLKSCRPFNPQLQPGARFMEPSVGRPIIDDYTDFADSRQPGSTSRKIG